MQGFWEAVVILVVLLVVALPLIAVIVGVIYLVKKRNKDKRATEVGLNPPTPTR